MSKRGRTGFTLALLALACAMLHLTLGMGAVARQIPLLVVAPLVVLLIAQAGRDVRAVLHPAAAGPPSGRAEQQSRPSALAWILLVPVLVELLGIVWGPSVYVLLFLRAQSREAWPRAIAAAALSALGLWVLFAVIIGTA